MNKFRAVALKIFGFACFFGGNVVYLQKQSTKNTAMETIVRMPRLSSTRTKNTDMTTIKLSKLGQWMRDNAANGGMFIMHEKRYNN